MGGWGQRTNQDTGEHDRGACPKVETGRATSFFETKMNDIGLNPDRIHPPSTYRPPPRAIFFFSFPFFVYFFLSSLDVSSYLCHLVPTITLARQIFILRSFYFSYFPLFIDELRRSSNVSVLIFNFWDDGIIGRGG